MAVFSNPLNIAFGDGRILMERFIEPDKTGSGLILRDTGKPGPVGRSFKLDAVANYQPQEGEVYLRFSNIESVQAMIASLQEVVDGWPEPAEPIEHAQSIIRTALQQIREMGFGVVADGTVHGSGIWLDELRVRPAEAKEE